MISRISQVVLLTGCLTLAGCASAFERKDVVPVIAGVAVAVLVGAAIHNSRDDRHRHESRQPPRVVYYQQQPHRHHRHGRQQVRYVAVPVHRGHGHHRRDRDHDRRDYRDRRNDRDHRNDRRW